MSDISVTAVKVAPVKESEALIRSFKAAVAITAGQAVYVLADGTVGVADANDSGKEQFAGIALETVGAGQAVDVLMEGEIYGFTLSGNAWTFVYLSNTAGALADAAGAMEVRVGRVVCLTDNDATKVLRVFTKWDTAWS